MKLIIEKKMKFFFGLISLGMLLLGVTAYKYASESAKHSKSVSQAYKVLYKADQVLSVTQDLAMGSRGYVITGDSSYLTPFIHSLPHVSAPLLELDKLTPNAPRQQARIDSLQLLIGERMAFSILVIDTRNTQGLEAATDLIETGKGKYLMDEIRRITKAIQLEENRLLEKRELAYDRSETAFVATFSFFLVSAVLLLVIAYRIIRSHITYQGKLEKQIRLMNRELAKRVGEKTREVLAKEKRYHFVLDNMLEGAQIIGSDWKYQYINKAAATQGKYAPEQLLGHTMFEMYPGFEKTDLFEVLQICMQEGVAQQLETEFIYPDKSKAYFKLSIQPIPEGLFILSMDISERKKQECDRERFIEELQEVLFKISHELRQPITQIMGLTSLLGKLSQEDFAKTGVFLKQAASTLDTYSRDLSEFVYSMQLHAKE